MMAVAGPAHRPALRHAAQDRRGYRQLPASSPRDGRTLGHPIRRRDAIALIHQTSCGYPRAVNTLAVEALVDAFIGKKAIVDEPSARTVACLPVFVMPDPPRVTRYSTAVQPCPSSSMPDAQWAVLEPLLRPPGNTGCSSGRSEKHPRRIVLDAIFYLARGGIAWR